MNKYLNLAIPIIVAVISASVVLYGYIWEKEKERDFQIKQTQQEIYTRLIKNLTNKLKYIDRLRRDKRIPSRVTSDNLEEVQKLIADNSPDLEKYFSEAREIMALLSIYGTDDAIKSVVDFYSALAESMQPDSKRRPNPGQLILNLRRTLFPDTTVMPEDINLIISS